MATNSLRPALLFTTFYCCFVVCSSVTSQEVKGKESTTQSTLSRLPGILKQQLGEDPRYADLIAELRELSAMEEKRLNEARAATKERELLEKEIDDVKRQEKLLTSEANSLRSEEQSLVREDEQLGASGTALNRKNKQHNEGVTSLNLLAKEINNLKYTECPNGEPFDKCSHVEQKREFIRRRDGLVKQYETQSKRLTAQKKVLDMQAREYLQQRTELKKRVNAHKSRANEFKKKKSELKLRSEKLIKAMAAWSKVNTNLGQRETQFKKQLKFWERRINVLLADRTINQKGSDDEARDSDLPSLSGGQSELAKWPYEALDRWKELSESDRTHIVELMEDRYGTDFADKFRQFASSGRFREPTGAYYGSGISFVTPSWLRQRGYVLAQRGGYHEWWVDPLGKWVCRNFSNESGSGQAVEEQRLEPEFTNAEDEDLFDVDVQIQRFLNDMDGLFKELARLEKLAASTPTNNASYCNALRRLERLRERFIVDEYNNVEIMRQEFIHRDPNRPKINVIKNSLDTYRETIRSSNVKFLQRVAKLPQCS